MIRQHRAATWVLLCLLVALFLLSMASPQIWDRAVRRQTSVETSRLSQPSEPPADADSLRDKATPPPQDVHQASGPQLAESLPGATWTPGVVRLTSVDDDAQPSDSPQEFESAEPAERIGGWNTPPLVADAAPREDLFSEPQPEPQADPQSKTEPELTSALPTPSLPPRAPSLVGLTPTRVRILSRRTTLARRPSIPDNLAPQTNAEPASPAAADVAGPIERVWHEPKSLIEALNSLTSSAPMRQWALDAGRLIDLLGTSAGSPKQTATIIEQLATMADATEPLSRTVDDAKAAKELRRTGHALRRRVDVWRSIAQFEPPAVAEDQPVQRDPEQLTFCLAEVDTLMAGSAASKAWREYLLLDVLRGWVARQEASEGTIPRELARQAIERLGQTPVSVSQRKFLSRDPLAKLRAELQHWAAVPVDSAALLEHQERYELSGLASDAKLLAEDCFQLSLSKSENRRRLAKKLQTHYRNANLRLAVTGDLLNRIIPKPEPEYAPVRETVLGKAVRGRSKTLTEVGVVLLPDAHRVRMALEITGKVSSLTTVNSGPATFWNNSHVTYKARKPMEVDLGGIRLWPAEVAVYNRMRLRGLKTDFDPIPLLGPLAKSVARSQHEQSQPAALSEVKRKVARRARNKIDTEAQKRLGEASRNLRKKVLDPLEALSLDPVLIAAETTDRRFTMRLRLAGEDQLGAHTPRPRAPGNSLASLQVHESVVNNVLRRLELEGQTFTLAQLSQRVSARFARDEPWETDPANSDVTITFAKQDAICVRLQDGRVEVTVSIAKLRKASRSWKNFKLRAFYRPRSNGLSAELVRDGVIQVIGRRLGTGSQIALRSVAAKTFSKRRPIRLTPKKLLENPGVADVELTQLVVDGGWFGAAIAEKTAIAEEEVADRPRLRR